MPMAATTPMISQSCFVYPQAARQEPKQQTANSVGMATTRNSRKASFT